MTQAIVGVVVASVDVDGRVVAASSMQVAIAVVHVVVASIDVDGT